MESDEQLIQQIINGNQPLFRELIVRYYAKVYSVALKVTNEPKDAEDVTQEVFLQVHHSLGQFQGKSNFYTWLYRMTMNKAMDWTRKQRQFQQQQTQLAVNAAVTGQHSPSAEQQVMQDLDRAVLQTHIHSLPTIYQQVLLLFYDEELSYRDIADRLQIELKTVESRLYRAKKLLHQKCQEGDP